MGQKLGKDLAGCLISDGCTSVGVSGPRESTCKYGFPMVFVFFSHFLQDKLSCKAPPIV